jgi:hypothetical protein
VSKALGKERGMSRQWWRRLLPDRSHLAMLAGIGVVIIATLGFIELYNIKVEALADHAAAQTQVEQLREQNQLLKDALVEGQKGENVEPKARAYFDFAMPGEKKIVFETPAALPQPTPVPRAPARLAVPRQVESWLGWLNDLLRG